MVTKSKKQVAGGKEGKKNRVKVGKLKLNRETVKDLTGDEARRVKGGVGGGGGTPTCVVVNRDGATGGGDVRCQ
jgi:hypothetical protein